MRVRKLTRLLSHAQVLRRSSKPEMRAAGAAAFLESAVGGAREDGLAQPSALWLACDSDTQDALPPELLACVEKEDDKSTRDQVRWHSSKSLALAPTPSRTRNMHRVPRERLPQLCHLVGSFGAALAATCGWDELFSRVFTWAAPVPSGSPSDAVERAVVGQVCAAQVLRHLGAVIALRHADKLSYFVQLFQRLLQANSLLPFSVRPPICRNCTTMPLCSLTTVMCVLASNRLRSTRFVVSLALWHGWTRSTASRRSACVPRCCRCSRRCSRLAGTAMRDALCWRPQRLRRQRPCFSTPTSRRCAPNAYVCSCVEALTNATRCVQCVCVAVCDTPGYQHVRGGFC